MPDVVNSVTPDYGDTQAVQANKLNHCLFISRIFSRPLARSSQPASLILNTSLQAQMEFEVTRQRCAPTPSLQHAQSFFEDEQAHPFAGRHSQIHLCIPPIPLR